MKSMKDTTGNEIGTEKKQKNLKKITNKTETTTLLLNKKLIEKLNYVLNSKGANVERAQNAILPTVKLSFEDCLIFGKQNFALPLKRVSVVS